VAHSDGTKEWRAFVLMPFADRHRPVFDILVPALEAEGYTVERADSEDNPHNIVRRFVEGIDRADLVVADVTESRPNVMYELGLAHALLKPTIIIVRKGQKREFDLSTYNQIEYDSHFSKVGEMVERVASMARRHRTGSVRFDNPVKDFAPSVQPKTSNAGSLEVRRDSPKPSDDKSQDMVAAFNRRMDSIAERINALSPKLTEKMNAYVATHPKPARGVKASSSARDFADALAQVVETYAEETKKDVVLLRDEWKAYFAYSETLVAGVPYPAGKRSLEATAFLTTLNIVDSGLKVIDDGLKVFGPELARLARQLPSPRFQRAAEEMNSVHSSFMVEVNGMRASVARMRNLLEFRLSG